MRGTVKKIFVYMNRNLWFIAEIILAVLLVAVSFEFFG